MRRVSAWASASILGVWLVAGVTLRATELAIDAPASLATAVSRVKGVDLARLELDLRRAGLRLPARIHVVLIPDGDPRAQRIPRWIVGFASGQEELAILPQRVLPYPYDSVESVFRHEVTHLALASRAGGRPLPRWFHEGVAMSVDAGWDWSGQLRLLFEMQKNPATADLARLFASDRQPDAAQAYGLSVALIADVQRRHGEASPGGIAGRVAQGVSFDRAFELETGEQPDEAAASAWRPYHRWSAWLPALTSGTAVWAAILFLAAVAYAGRRRRRARQRRRWDEDEPV